MEVGLRSKAYVRVVVHDGVDVIHLLGCVTCRHTQIRMCHKRRLRFFHASLSLHFGTSKVYVVSVKNELRDTEHRNFSWSNAGSVDDLMHCLLF